MVLMKMLWRATGLALVLCNTANDTALASR